MYERLLIPLLGSSLADIVLPRAEELFATFGAKLVLANAACSDKFIECPEVLSNIGGDYANWNHFEELH